MRYIIWLYHCIYTYVPRSCMVCHCRCGKTFVTLVVRLWSPVTYLALFFIFRLWMLFVMCGSRRTHTHAITRDLLQSFLVLHGYWYMIFAKKALVLLTVINNIGWHWNSVLLFLFQNNFTRVDIKQYPIRSNSITRDLLQICLVMLGY